MFSTKHLIARLAFCLAFMASPAIAGANRASLFGVELGSPITLSRCPIETIGGLFGSGGTENVKDHSDMCWGAPQFMLSAEQHTPSSLPADGDVGIYFPSMRRPDYADKTSFDATLRNGVVYMMRMSAGGTGDQKDVMDALKSKFGNPSSLQQKNLSNSFGATFNLFNAEWNVPSGDVVKYEGYIDNYSVGSIWVMTPEAAQAEAARRAQFAAPKM